MSLLAALASAALASTGLPIHTVDVEHRGSTHQVAYRPLAEVRRRTIGMSAGTRPSTERCVVSARVTVERSIGAQASAHALKSVLPGSREFTEQLPGSCLGREKAAGALLANKSGAIAAHLASVAGADRQAALAAIETAHHFAAN